MHWTLRFYTALVYFNIICARVHWIELNCSAFYGIRWILHSCTIWQYLLCFALCTSQYFSSYCTLNCSAKAGWDCDNISRCHGPSSVQSITLQGAARDVALAVIVGDPDPVMAALILVIVASSVLQVVVTRIHKNLTSAVMLSAWAFICWESMKSGRRNLCRAWYTVSPLDPRLRQYDTVMYTFKSRMQRQFVELRYGTGGLEC